MITLNPKLSFLAHWQVQSWNQLTETNLSDRIVKVFCYGTNLLVPNSISFVHAQRGDHFRNE